MNTEKPVIVPPPPHAHIWAPTVGHHPPVGAEHICGRKKLILITNYWAGEYNWWNTQRSSGKSENSIAHLELVGVSTCLHLCAWALSSSHWSFSSYFTTHPTHNVNVACAPALVTQGERFLPVIVSHIHIEFSKFGSEKIGSKPHVGVVWNAFQSDFYTSLFLPMLWMLRLHF